MKLKTGLLELFKCDDLETLLQRASSVFERLGFPYLIMKWNPTASTESAMVSSSCPVWSNFSTRLGESGYALTETLSGSIEFGLSQAKENTLERQDWIARRRGTFRMAHDAPKPFDLTPYQFGLICDYGEEAWNEFVSHPLCRERDRVLLLEAMTQEEVSEERMASAQQVFTVFETIYRRLQTLTPTQTNAIEGQHAQSYLSHREIECLSWLAAGKTLQEAAIILDISERTLRFHIANARNRLGVATTMQAVVAAALTYGFDPSDTRRSVYTASRRSKYPAA